MGPAQAISSGFRKAFVFSGRASRSEFWWFFPVGVALPLCGAALGISLNAGYWTNALLVLAFAVPLFAVGARRLQDTGESGLDAMTPWGHFFVSATVIHGFLRFADHAEQLVSQAGNPAGFFLALIVGALILTLLLVSLFFSISFLVLITPAFGQCLVPGQRGPNRFGENPLEHSA